MTWYVEPLLLVDSVKLIYTNFACPLKCLINVIYYVFLNRVMLISAQTLVKDTKMNNFYIEKDILYTSFNTFIPAHEALVMGTS
jgi:hypothetical protein